MGNYFSFLSKNKLEHTDPILPQSTNRSKKRKLNDDLNDEELTNTLNLYFSCYNQNTESTTLRSQQINEKSHFSKIGVKQELIRPIRKKMKSTSNYIYKTLFINGENSDIIVKALNQEWLLHKLYLCQSPYFDSMFKGSKWKESTQSYIEISIPDQNINEKSLYIAFGSFYKEDIEIMPIEVINVLACASLFSLDGLINQCEIIMLENMNSQTVLAYYDASIVYGVTRVTEKALKWLCQNLMINDEIKLDFLSMNLFEKILSMKDLMIIQVETDLYSLCKKWLYFNLNKVNMDKLDGKSWQKVANEYFKNLINEKYDFVEDKPDVEIKKRICLLDDVDFKKYVPIFRKIRFQHIITDLTSLRLLYCDRIIPTDWIEPFYEKNWLNLLFIDQDKFSSEFELDPIEFETECLRFGRLLNDDQPATWRWVGFNYGVDLLVTHTARALSLKRNTIAMHSPYRGLLSNKTHLRIYYVLSLVELDSNGNEVWSKKTDLNCLDLSRSEEKFVFTLDSKVKFPILLNLHISTHPFNIQNNTNNLNNNSNLFSTNLIDQ